MTADRISLKGATTHFLHTEGPRGFLLRFALVYAILTLVLQAVGVWTQAPVYELYLRAIVENVFNDWVGRLVVYEDFVEGK
jgi:hypothetical protein